ncbi:MAG TPA: tetratricopeptide repeat-containing sensor histidine kinase [Chryseosolibacter sp.]|nr:tetratricopeptide repeat-containing sensor histidine kinase [Chryseosolibacter sp.]
MQFRFLSFLILISVLTAHAQRSRIDSLESLVNSVPADTTKVWLLNELVSDIRNTEIKKAEKLADEALKLAMVLNYEFGIAQALEHSGWVFYRKGEYGKAYDQSIRALRIYNKIGNEPGAGRALITMAVVYYEHNQFSIGIDNMKRAYNINVRHGDSRGMMRCLSNISYGYIQLANVDSAEFYMKRSLEVSKHVQDDYLYAYALRCLGDIDVLKGDFKRSLDNYHKGLNLVSDEKHAYLYSSILNRVGVVHNQIGEFDKALTYLHDNHSLTLKFSYKELLAQTYKALSESYKYKNDIARAYDFQSRYLKLHDSLHNKQQEQQIALLQSKFESELKQAQIDVLTAEAQAHTGEIKSQRAWMYFYTGCISLLILLALVLVYNYRYTWISKRRLEEKNDAIERQAQQLRYLNATKDKLFSVISHDLRSPLSSLKALMELVGTAGLTQQEFVNITIVLKRNLDTVHADLDNLLMWAQTQLKGLQPFPSNVNVRQIVEEKFKLFRENAASKRIELINHVDDNVFIHVDRNHLGSVIRNLLANAIKFNPTGGRVVIYAILVDNTYEITIEDSGIGMSSEDIDKLFDAQTHFTRPGTNKEKGVGIGLLLTKEFIETNNGAIRVTSELDKGTSFTISFAAADVSVPA